MHWHHDLDRHATALRRFNRFYMARLQRLRDAMKGPSMHASYLRVLRELGTAEEGVGGALIAARVRMSKAYVSRILAWYRSLGYLQESADPTDRRRRVLELTRAGREGYGRGQRRAQEAARGMLLQLPPEERVKLVAAMAEIERILRGVTWHL